MHEDKNDKGAIRALHMRPTSYRGYYAYQRVPAKTRGATKYLYYILDKVAWAGAFPTGFVGCREGRSRKTFAYL